MWRHTLLILLNVKCPKNGWSDVWTPPPSPHHLTPPPLNSTWHFGLRKFSCQTLGWWGDGGISTWHQTTTTTTPISQTVKNFFSGFRHFIKFPATLVQVNILTPTPISQTLTFFFLVDLGISSNFLQLWFRWTFWHLPPPNPPHWPNSGKNFLVDLGISSNFLQLWFRWTFWLPLPLPLAKQWKNFFYGFRHFIKFPATLVNWSLWYGNLFHGSVRRGICDDILLAPGVPTR